MDQSVRVITGPVANIAMEAGVGKVVQQAPLAIEIKDDDYRLILQLWLERREATIKQKKESGRQIKKGSIIDTAALDLIVERLADKMRLARTAPQAPELPLEAPTQPVDELAQSMIGAVYLVHNNRNQGPGAVTRDKMIELLSWNPSSEDFAVKCVGGGSEQNGALNRRVRFATLQDSSTYELVMAKGELTFRPFPSRKSKRVND